MLEVAYRPPLVELRVRGEFFLKHDRFHLFSLPRAVYSFVLPASSCRWPCLPCPFVFGYSLFLSVDIDHQLYDASPPLPATAHPGSPIANRTGAAIVIGDHPRRPAPCDQNTN